MILCWVLPGKEALTEVSLAFEYKDLRIIPKDKEVHGNVDYLLKMHKAGKIQDHQIEAAFKDLMTEGYINIEQIPEKLGTVTGRLKKPPMPQNLPKKLTIKESWSEDGNHLLNCDAASTLPYWDKMTPSEQGIWQAAQQEVLDGILTEKRLQKVGGDIVKAAKARLHVKANPFEKKGKSNVAGAINAGDSDLPESARSNWYKRNTGR